MGSRLLALPTGTKSTIDNDQLALAPEELDAFTIDLSSIAVSEKSLKALSAKDFSDIAVEDVQPRMSRALQLASRLLAKVTADSAQLNVIATGGAGQFSLEPCSTSSSQELHDLHIGTPSPSPVMWPMQNMQTPWIDMKMYQAPQASQIPSGAQANGFLVLQPVLMPVYSPFWGMQMSLATQQPTELAGTMFPAEAIGVVTQQCGGPLTHWEAPQPNLAAPPSTEPARRHRRSRRGGVSMRKKLGGVACPEEVEELSCSLTEAQVCVPNRTLRWADVEIEEASTEAPESPCVSPAADPVCQMEKQDGEVAGESCKITCEGAEQPKEPAFPSFQRNSSDDSPVFTQSASTVDPLLLELEEVDETKRQFALDWVLSSFWPLALTKRGCRIVQKAIEVGTPAYQQQLLENMHGRVDEALKSPHTNYVLQKCIETMPSEKMQFVLMELQGQGLNVARHRFGCRILQRLIEHCHPSQTEPLINEVLADAASLCRHQYGNFIIQHILQHGTPVQRSAIADVIGKDIIRLAKHRIASHVVSSAMVHCPAEDVQRLTHAVLHDAGQLADLSRREYGSFVVREVNRAAKMMRT